MNVLIASETEVNKTTGKGPCLPDPSQPPSTSPLPLSTLHAGAGPPPPHEQPKGEGTEAGRQAVPFLAPRVRGMMVPKEGGTGPVTL